MSIALDPIRPPSYNVADQARMAAAVNYFAWQARLVLPELGRRVVEVGCGAGNFTAFLLDREGVLAIDADAACLDRLRQRYPRQENLTASLCNAESAEYQS